MKKENSFLKNQSEQSSREVCHLQEELKKTKQCLTHSQNLAEEMKGKENLLFQNYFSKLPFLRESIRNFAFFRIFSQKDVCIQCGESFLLTTFQFPNDSWTLFYWSALSPQKPGFQHFEARGVNISHIKVNCQC